MDVADIGGARSKCTRARVGCVIVDEAQNVLAVSYNGPPPHYPAEGSCINWCPRAQGLGGTTNDYSNCPSTHAEINAISRMSRNHGVTTTAYVNRMCCNTCAKALASAGVSRVVCKVTDIDGHLDSEGVATYLAACGVILDLMETQIATTRGYASSSGE